MKRSGKLSEDRVGKLTSIGFVWDIGLNDWDEMLSELKHFKETHGHCNVSNESSEEPKLNEWLDEQRRKFQSGKLAPDRLLKLEQIGIVFQPPESPEDISHRIWNEMCECLAAYKGEYGDCDVPRYVDKLGWWVVCQRKLRLDRTLEPDFIRRLDEIGFVWNRKEYFWEKMYSTVKEQLSLVGISGLESYIRQDGESQTEIRKWVEAQWSAKKRGVLNRQKQYELDEIGFPWQFPKKPKESTKPSWESIFAQLVEFQKKHGHCDMKLVPPLDEHLHKWSQVQRQAKESGALTVDQIRQLDQIGFIWQTDDLLWERMLKTLIAYKSAHGNCNVPLDSKQDSQLAVWVASQRKRRKKGGLKFDQIERLDQIRFAW